MNVGTVPMPTFPDESISIERPAALLNTKTFDPGVTPVAVGGIAWMLPTTVKFAKRLLHIRPARGGEFYSRRWCRVLCLRIQNSRRCVHDNLILVRWDTLDSRIGHHPSHLFSDNFIVCNHRASSGGIIDPFLNIRTRTRKGFELDCCEFYCDRNVRHLSLIKKTYPSKIQQAVL